MIVIGWKVMAMPRHLAQFPGALCLVLALSPAISPAGTSDLDGILQQAKALGAPMAAVARAIEISRQPVFAKKDVLAVFDIAQLSSKKRFYVFDFADGKVTAHYAAHGRHNGPNARQPNSRASRAIWTWCRSARSRPRIPK